MKINLCKDGLSTNILVCVDIDKIVLYRESDCNKYTILAIFKFA